MNKNSKAIGYFVLMLLAAILFILMLYSYNVSKNTTYYFKQGKTSTAERVYNSIMQWDLDEAYPRTPEEVMQINIDIMYLTYGDMIIEDEIYINLIEQQRKLYGDELIEKNTAESQFAFIKEGVLFLEEHKLATLQIIQKPVIYDPFDNNLCFIRTEQTYNDSTKLYWEYELRRSSKDDVWKINRWHRTDETYVNIIE